MVGDVAAQAAHLYGVRERLADDDVSVAYCTRRQPALPVAAAVIEQVDRQLFGRAGHDAVRREEAPDLRVEPRASHPSIIALRDDVQTCQGAY